ncbi:MAG: helix-turn-helix transcriptional regulator [Acutalibacteraceae bacterium]|nr:helix-turn-helix transcriptional regulator [Acutalibacteraceae bacterium]
MDPVFASRLRLLRKQKQVSQKKAAEDLGVSQALLSHYENGIRECGLDFVVRAADYYGVSTDYLLGHSNDIMEYDPSRILIEDDDPEDQKMSPRTLLRATMVLWEQIPEDSPLKSRALSTMALTVYQVLWQGVRTGAVPASWSGAPDITARQLHFLMLQMVETMEQEPAGKRRGRGEAVPNPVSTLTRYVYDQLNRYLADLL